VKWVGPDYEYPRRCFGHKRQGGVVRRCAHLSWPVRARLRPQRGRWLPLNLVAASPITCGGAIPI